MVNNKWINHVKNYADENNLSYACALSQPNVKTNYEKVKRNQKTTSKRKVRNNEISKYRIFKK